MEIRGRYYFFAVITCFLGAFLLYKYHEPIVQFVYTWFSTFATIVFLFYTWLNTKRIQWRDFGHTWYARREFTFKDVEEKDYRGLGCIFRWTYSDKMLRDRENIYPFSLSRISCTMLLSFIINQILLWCDKHLSHKIKIDEN